jgi:acyl-CoA hydrolase
MGHALAMDNVCEIAASEKARERIESAQLSDMAFLVRKIAHKPLTDDEIVFLASVLIEATHRSTTVSKEEVIKIMLERGRSQLASLALSDAIFK